MSADDSERADGARMVLEPKAIHEGDENNDVSVDCPQCGATVSIMQIVEEGRCTGQLDPDVAEAEGNEEQLETGCNAKLSLELVWEA